MLFCALHHAALMPSSIKGGSSGLIGVELMGCQNLRLLPA
jgi:hypothetical protein